jgi:hypothetical protein
MEKTGKEEPPKAMLQLWSESPDGPPDLRVNNRDQYRGYQTLRLHSLVFLCSMSVNSVFAISSASQMAPA